MKGNQVICALRASRQNCILIFCFFILSSGLIAQTALSTGKQSKVRTQARVFCREYNSRSLLQRHPFRAILGSGQEPATHCRASVSARELSGIRCVKPNRGRYNMGQGIRLCPDLPPERLSASSLNNLVAGFETDPNSNTQASQSYIHNYFVGTLLLNSSDLGHNMFTHCLTTPQRHSDPVCTSTGSKSLHLLTGISNSCGSVPTSRPEDLGSGSYEYESVLRAITFQSRIMKKRQLSALYRSSCRSGGFRVPFLLLFQGENLLLQIRTKTA